MANLKGRPHDESHCDWQGTVASALDKATFLLLLRPMVYPERALLDVISPFISALGVRQLQKGIAVQIIF